ncbi:hypothetical protein HYN43_016730 [Mucilaginibacter celer]|uniref:Uncharacterized protein n=1 Tax=Mucilaginibacter celer TaxID=2305508 RepID=A0A494VN91_9SPHI|nr:hypothetical protein HYN43_016730 [Mucilaginibacter celer]
MFIACKDKPLMGNDYVDFADYFGLEKKISEINVIKKHQRSVLTFPLQKIKKQVRVLEVSMVLNDTIIDDIK